jgi:cytochrome c553
MLVPLAGTVSAEAVTGAAIYTYCEACHGKQGAGDANGTFPRIAGLPAAYIDKQLHDFKEERRSNKPMVPIFQHHRFDDEVIATVAEHIAAMRVPDLGLWPFQPDPDLTADYTADYPDGEALRIAGAEKFAADCAACHGERAEGDAAGVMPPLVQQYPAYVRKQVADFASGKRKHSESARCAAITPAELEAVIAHLVELGK